jgi:hypothetical protein
LGGHQNPSDHFGEEKFLSPSKYELIHNRGYNSWKGSFLEVAEIPSKVNSEVLKPHFWSVSKKLAKILTTAGNIHFLFLNCIHKQRPNIKQ